MCNFKRKIRSSKKPTLLKGFRKSFFRNPLCARDHRDYFVLVTASFERPLRRRRASTFRPLVDLLRTKKPCVFARFFFFGLYVNDIPYRVPDFYIKSTLKHRLSFSAYHLKMKTLKVKTRNKTQELARFS